MVKMPTPDHTRAYLLGETVEDAWADVPHPGEGGLVVTGEQDLEAIDIARSLDHKHWKELDYPLLAQGVFNYLSPLGIWYYLPAWVSYCLDIQRGERLKDGFANDIPTISFIAFALSESSVHRIPLSTDQMKCVRDCLEYMLCHPGFYGLDELDVYGNRQEPQVREAIRRWNTRIATAPGE